MTTQTISIAPMMDWTDRHCRYFHRLISPHARLYTEMVTTGALLHGDKERFLRFDDSEHPVALQLGGSEPDALAECAKMGDDFGYDEINLNCGCPSERVQKGSFGARLMKEPELVADCIAAMKKATTLPVTVKCRIGVDDSEDYTFLENFIRALADVGCDHFVIHARKALLKGLSPKENREVPPLRYDIVQEIKKNFPSLPVTVNGGIRTLDAVHEHLKDFEGAMIGREAYQNPWFLHEIEKDLYGAGDISTRDQIVERMIPYIEHQQRAYGTPVKSIVRHMLGLYNGLRGAKSWRQRLSTQMIDPDVSPGFLRDSMPL